MQLENLLEMLSGYSSADKEFVLRAYAFAKHAHKGQTRKSGEPYITHPVAVTCILCSTHADRDTLAAGLLHDVVEDCNVPLEVIEETFNKTVANRVNGVTKIGKEELEDPIARRDANLTKILKSINQDICIILIKAADRLHNLLTMEYMDKEKAKAKARETLEVYVPIMSLIGEYKIKNQLEDNAFKYFEPDEYKRIEEMREEYVDKKRNIIEEMILSTTYALHEEECEYDLSLRIKHLYGIRQRLLKYGSIDNIHDIFSIKVLIDDLDKCYSARDKISTLYDLMPGKSKDYIESPKTNRYSALHISEIGPDNTMVQFQFLRPDMDRVNQYGLTEYWKNLKNEGNLSVSQEMQDEVKKRQFYRFLEHIGEENLSPSEYADEVRSDILTRMIYVQTPSKSVVELPYNSTVLDYAFRVNPEKAQYLWASFVNGERKELTQRLANKDEIKLLYNEEKSDLTGLDEFCNTHYAKRKIRSMKDNK